MAGITHVMLRAGFALALVGITSAGNAETVYAPHGAKGDGGGELRCPANSYVVGLEGGTGQIIDRIAINCAPLDASGAAIAVNFRSEALGGGGGGPASRACPAKSVAAAGEVRLNKLARQVEVVYLECRTLSDNKVIGYTKIGGVGDDVTWHGLDGDQSTRQFRCKPGEAMSGLTVRHGEHVNAVGLICNTIIKPAVRVVLQTGRAPPPRGTSFVGSWDTVTEQGSRFELELSNSDGEIGGRFTLIGGPTIYGGTMQGKLESNGTGLRFTYRQNNGATGKGIFALSADGRTIDGVGTADNPPLMFTWKGTRK